MFNDAVLSATEHKILAKKEILYMVQTKHIRIPGYNGT